MTTQKSAPLTREEVLKLLEIVEAHPIVFSKATNATNNQLKEVAWSKITSIFNSIIESAPRTAEQLRLKWENLKKVARKRSSKIKKNNLKSGSGKPEYIPPNEALDKVNAILSSACGEYKADKESNKEEIEEEVDDEEPLIPVATFFSTTPNKDKLNVKKKALSEKLKMSICERNIAVANYYKAKTRKLELEIREMERNLSCNDWDGRAS